MKIKKLYIKIFISFIFLLAVSEILIFGVFKALYEKQIDIEVNRELQNYFFETVYLFRDVVEEKIQNRSDLPANKNPELKKIVKKLSDKYDLSIWMEIPGIGQVSFTEDKIPDITQIADDNLKDAGDFSYKIRMGKEGTVYIKIPIKMHAGKEGFIFVFHKREPFFHRLPFIKGLLLIGICLAFLLYPFSRVITQPLKKLTRSVYTFAEGDLSHRVRIKTKDEIGRLAESFNRMAAKIEGMIKGTKEMTANISHELRSPLARIRIAQEMLAKKLNSHDKDINKYLKSIEDEIEEMDLLLGQVLNLTKMDIRDKAEKEDIDVGNIVSEIIKSYETVFDKRGISTTVNIVDDSLITKAVRDDIKTIFRNIIDNASKYTTENGRISVELDKSDNSICAVISNTCENLNEDELLNILRPFYRSSADNTVPGYGLGLAITKKILDTCSGNIEFQNTNEGLAVKITIPVT